MNSTLTVLLRRQGDLHSGASKLKLEGFDMQRNSEMTLIRYHSKICAMNFGANLPLKAIIEEVVKPEICIDKREICAYV